MFKTVQESELNLLKEYIEYDPEQGTFICIKNRCRSRAGGTAGYKTDQGYIEIKLFYKVYYAHRVAWFLYYTEWPSQEIDHINGIRSDNRIINLRQVDRSGNVQNIPVHRNGQPVGVTWEKKSKKWRAQLPKKFLNKNSTVKRYLGLYETMEDAAQAIINFCKKE